MKSLSLFSTRRHIMLSAVIAAVSLASQVASAADISFSSPQLYAESGTWSAKQNVFMVGSVRHGTVGKVTPEGRYVPFIKDKRLISTLGMTVDDKRNTLWVTNADPGAGDRTNDATKGKLAAIATYNATTGAPRAYYDLSAIDPGAHLANDVVLDAAGNAYITDSFAPVIYKIDTQGHASVFAKDARFKTGDGFNLNGIAWHPDGYLLIGNYNSGQLFRVSTKDPSDIQAIALPEALKGADGFNLIDKQHLIVVQNAGVDRTIELHSVDGWKSAEIVRVQKSEQSMPSAAINKNGHIYVLNSRIDTLFSKDAPKVNDFLLQQF